MSRHNVYPQFSTIIVARYQKTTIYPIAGKRLDPYDNKRQIDFILRTDERNYNFETKHVTFVYDSEVVELYSADEVQLFTALNRGLVEAGLLKPYTEQRPEMNMANVLSDEEIYTIANESNHLRFEAALRRITSPITMQRILAQIPDTRAVRFVRIAENRLKELT